MGLVPYIPNSLLHRCVQCSNMEIRSSVCFGCCPHTPGTSTYGKDESDSFGRGDEWWKNNSHRDQIPCRHHWSILFADVPLTAEGQFLLLNHYKNHCSLRATKAHKEGAGKILFSWVLKHCRDSFVGNYALALKSYTCLKSFFETRGI